ncbi:MAG: MBL fold metallo-hydrolase [Alphaproteobacteria bacterium]|nr:MBL fold metallo-hydrolase [Alphaproteobacteria bacterium]
MTVHIDAAFDDATKTVSYIVSDPSSGRAAIVDSVLDYDPASGRTGTEGADALIAKVEAAGLTVDYILETHIHADHLSAALYLKERLGAPICVGDRVGVVQETFRDVYNLGRGFPCDGSQFDRLLADGERLALGTLEFEVMHVPGHTPACVAYRIEDALLTGDTLFMPDFGSARCDFPGGDARELYRSVSRILSLPPETRLFLCHDYAPGGRDYVWETTVGEQREKNIHMRDGTTEDQFVAFREARDRTLTMPVLILPSVQVNIRAGRMPEPDDNGTSYLKIPLNRF